MYHVICITAHVVSLSNRSLQPFSLFHNLLIFPISKCIIPVYFITFFLAKIYPCHQIVMYYTDNRTCPFLYCKLTTDYMCTDAYYIIYDLYGSLYIQYITTSGILIQTRALWGLLCFYIVIHILYRKILGEFRPFLASIHNFRRCPNPFSET